MRHLLLLAGMLIGPAAFAQDDPPPLPEKVEPRLLLRGISFAEGPTFDSKGNLFFVNYKGNGNIGRLTPAGDASVWLKLPDPSPEPGGKVLRAFPFGLKADSQDRLIAADYGGRQAGPFAHRAQVSQRPGRRPEPKHAVCVGNVDAQRRRL